jgi:hypothetical protein
MSRSAQWRSTAALFLLFLLTSGGIAQRKVPVTGFFTNMEYVKQAGDVVGMEVWIVYARGRYWATVQLAEGEPDPPVVVPAHVSEQHVSFVLKQPSIRSDGSPAPDRVLKFEGTITRSALTGTFANERMMLKRGSTYWQ